LKSVGRLQDSFAYPPRLLRADRAAAYLGLGTSTFLRLVSDGVLPRPKHIKGVVAWDRFAHDAYVDSIDDEGNTIDRILRGAEMKKHYKYLDETSGYIYFRLNGKRIALPGQKGSAEFDAEYDRLFAEAQRKKGARAQEGKQRTEQRERNSKGGVASVEWFIQKFLASEFFVGQHGKAAIFAPGTQKNYRLFWSACALTPWGAWLRRSVRPSSPNSRRRTRAPICTRLPSNAGRQ
jgi:predicted DNA-binding transcriptional regulator AlpA